ncbi:hypothetical protein NPIL_388391 [Nephila pilipes]|uniref:Uncharacterized protein n=1 Tax=Nephila pilipes TaxID=299642 RepID=A0A8X6NT13_NEPPI|nr:hypothetical protein NPIL_388391 [Nephila pilipes]
MEHLRRQLRGEQEYFSFNNFGHVAKDCHFSCTLCGESGRGKYKSEHRMITVNVCEQESSIPYRYMKPVFVNDPRVTAPLDMGSSSCLLKKMNST